MSIEYNIYLSKTLSQGHTEVTPTTNVHGDIFYC